MERVSMTKVERETKDKEGGEVANWGEKNNRRQNYKVTESRIRKGLEARRIEDDLQKR